VRLARGWGLVLETVAGPRPLGLTPSANSSSFDQLRTRNSNDQAPEVALILSLSKDEGGPEASAQLAVHSA